MEIEVRSSLRSHLFWSIIRRGEGRDHHNPSSRRSRRPERHRLSRLRAGIDLRRRRAEAGYRRSRKSLRSREGPAGGRVGPRGPSGAQGRGGGRRPGGDRRGHVRRRHKLHLRPRLREPGDNISGEAPAGVLWLIPQPRALQREGKKGGGPRAWPRLRPSPLSRPGVRHGLLKLHRRDRLQKLPVLRAVSGSLVGRRGGGEQLKYGGLRRGWWLAFPVGR